MLRAQIKKANEELLFLKDKLKVIKSADQSRKWKTIAGQTARAKASIRRLLSEIIDIEMAASDQAEKELKENNQH